VNGFIDHLYTPLGTTLYRSVTHKYYCPRSIRVQLAVSWQRLQLKKSLQLPALRSFQSHPCRTLVNCQPSTNWVPGWRPFHTNLQIFSSGADFQLNSVLPTSYFTSVQFSSLQFTSLHFGSLQFSSVQFTSVQFSSVHLSSVQFSSVQFTSVHFTSLHFTSLHLTSLN
jgi:hypothetical protein